MKKNLVVVGYGGMGGWHTQHAQKSDVVNLLGIYDIDPKKTALARERGIFAYDSLEQVLSDELTILAQLIQNVIVKFVKNILGLIFAIFSKMMKSCHQCWLLITTCTFCII